MPIAAGLSTEIQVLSDANHTWARIPNPIVDRRALMGVGHEDPVLPGFASVVHIKEYFVTDGGSLSNINYEDTSKALVNIELAGGLCNRTIGDAIILIKRDKCINYKRPVLIQTFQTPMLLPAQQLTVQFGTLQSDYLSFNLEVKRYLHATHNDTAVVDYRNVTDVTSVYNTVRFEYHPAPTLRIDIPAAHRASCVNPKAVPPLVSDSAVFTNITVYVTEQFPGVQPCEDVQGTLNLTSYLGEVGSSEPLFTVCQAVPCNLTIFSDQAFSPLTNVTYKVRSRATVMVGIGYPSLFPPYTKSVFARMPSFGHVDSIEVCPAIVLHCIMT